MRSEHIGVEKADLGEIRGEDLSRRDRTSEKNEAEQSGARILDMSGVKRAVQRYNIRTRRAKRS